MRSPLDFYRTVWLVDFEFGQSGGPGGPHEPRCVVAKEFKSGRTIRQWLCGTSFSSCPYDTDDGSLFVSFYAAAETACHVALGWPMPRRILDLHAELRLMLNGRQSPAEDELKKKKIGRSSLLACLYHFGLSADCLAAAEKKEMRDLALRGGPYSPEEQQALLDYNETDVIALEKLLPVMVPKIKNFGQALFRGRYTGNLGYLEYRGIPLDGATFRRLRSHWPQVVDRLIETESVRFDVLKHRDVDNAKFALWIESRGIRHWPTTKTGKLQTDRDTLSEMARIHGGDVNELKEFLTAIRQTKLFDQMTVGSDNRNRFLVSPFASKTGRNQPSSAASVFGASAWVRQLIRPREGFGLAYCDYSGQEYAIAAYLSRDKKMIEDYEQGDCYLAFGKRAGIVPLDATKTSHKNLRTKLKVALGLGAIYGAGSETVARSGQMAKSDAERFLALHKQTYQEFWEWRRRVVNHAAMHSEMVTPLGWTFAVGANVTSTTSANWPMQSTAADMLRVATCNILDAGVSVVALIHDAVLIEAPLNRLDEAIHGTMREMQRASRQVLGNAGELRVDASRIAWPSRFRDERGTEMWKRILAILDEVSGPSDIVESSPID